MSHITKLSDLEKIYGSPSKASLKKVAKRMTPLYRQWVEQARFLVLSTIGPDGTDGSPRGDDGPVVHIADDTTLHLPDWRGNNRLDSLRNIVRDPRCSLMFMVPGSQNVVRANGRAVVSADPTLCQSLAKEGKAPQSVIIFSVEEIYFQCAKAIMRSNIWSGKDESGNLPTAGAFLQEMQDDFDGATYDADYKETAVAKLW